MLGMPRMESIFFADIVATSAARDLVDLVVTTIERNDEPEHSGGG